MSTTTTTTVLTVREALAFATGKAKVTDAQYGRALATIGSQEMTLALVAYGIATRGLTGVDKGTASLTRLASDTLTEREGESKADRDKRVQSRRSALSKLSSTIGRLVTAGVEMTPETFDAVRIAGDSTADGRKILDAAVARASKDDDKSAALVYLLDAAAKARASKAAARTTREAGKAPQGGKGKPEQGKAAAPAVPLTWAQSLAILAATAEAEAAALDADALTLASGYAASIADALADATATVTAALATARSKRQK